MLTDFYHLVPTDKSIMGIFLKEVVFPTWASIGKECFMQLFLSSFIENIYIIGI